jgi:hypothetical protein
MRGEVCAASVSTYIFLQPLRGGTPLPPILLSPFVWRAVQIGALAAVAAYASRQRGSEPKDVEHERVLDGLPEGVAVGSHRAEAERGIHAAGRIRRVLRFGPGGAGLEIEASGLGRLRMRRAV